MILTKNTKKNNSSKNYITHKNTVISIDSEYKNDVYTSFQMKVDYIRDDKKFFMRVIVLNKSLFGRSKLELEANEKDHCVNNIRFTSMREIFKMMNIKGDYEDIVSPDMKEYTLNYIDYNIFQTDLFNYGILPTDSSLLNTSTCKILEESFETSQYKKIFLNDDNGIKNPEKDDFDIETLVYGIGDNIDLIYKILKDFNIESKLNTLLYHYSIKDLIAGWGKKKTELMLLGNVCNTDEKGEITVLSNKTQPEIYCRRGLQTKGDKPLVDFYQDEKLEYKVRDTFNFFGTSLDNTCTYLGIKLDNKKDLEKYDFNPERFLKEDPKSFFHYAMQDVEYLAEIPVKSEEMFRKIIKEITSIELDENVMIPATLGSRTALLIEYFIKSYFIEYSVIYDYINIRNGIKNFSFSDTRIIDDKIKFIDKKLQQKKNIVDLKENSEFMRAEFLNGKSLEDILKEIGSNPCKFNSNKAENYAVVRLLGVVSVEKFRTGELINRPAALVHGGRCNNEQPFDPFKMYGADVDLKQAYGSAMMDVDYNLGHPSIINRLTNPDITLKHAIELVKKYSKDNNWIIIVNDEIGSKDNNNSLQDLVFSKLNPKYEKTIKNIDDDEDDEPYIENDFRLLRKELFNGCITHHTWEILEKVASDHEKKYINELKVEICVYYKESDRCTTVEEFIEKQLATPLHTQSKAFFGVPIKNMVENLINKRIFHKKLSQDLSITNEERFVHMAIQENFKLCVNTMYGVLGSPYFEISNTILANNITDCVRSNIWKVSKALNLVQTITDGGSFSVLEIPNFKLEKKPGLKTLSMMYNWQSDRRKFTTLGEFSDENWKYAYNNPEEPESKELLDSIDDLCLKTINNFCNMYDLSFPFEIEIKKEHIFLKALYDNKADYAFLTIYKHKEDSEKRKNHLVLKHPSGYKMIIKKRGFKTRDLEYYQKTNLQYPFFYKRIIESFTCNSIYEFHRKSYILLGETMTYKSRKMLKYGLWAKKTKKTNDKAYKHLENIGIHEEYIQETLIDFSTSKIPRLNRADDERLNKIDRLRCARNPLKKTGFIDLLNQSERALLTKFNELTHSYLRKS